MVLRLVGLVFCVAHGGIFGAKDPKSGPWGHGGSPPATDGGEIDPLKDGKRVERSENAHGISIYHRAKN